ncbi:MAG: PHP domain-containing protein [Planctomycetota bacterium]
MELPPLGFDLHVHTHYSDGADSPQAVVDQCERRLSVVSICDHDTIAAYDHLPEAPALDVLPGIEISTGVDGRSIHLLGYFRDGFPNSFRDAVGELEHDRRSRIQEGVTTLRERGVPLRWRALEEALGEGVPCRSHVARALIKVGVARSPRVVFARYLQGAFRGPRIGVAEAIQLVRDNGGLAVWAHPDAATMDSHGVELAAAGLQGVEVYRRGGKQAPRRRKVERFAERHGLLKTGGSGHHFSTPRRRLGEFSIPFELLPESLRR